MILLILLIADIMAGGWAVGNRESQPRNVLVTSCGRILNSRELVATYRKAPICWGQSGASFDQTFECPLLKI